MIKKVISVFFLALLVTSCAKNKNILEDIPEILIPKNWGKKIEEENNKS